MQIRVKVRGDDRLRRLADRLDSAAAGFDARMVRALQGESGQALSAVQAAFLTVEVSSPKGGGYSSGLRGRVAAATHAYPSGSGTRFEVESAQVDPAYGNTLSFGINGLGRWRAPTFGRTSAGSWHTQRGQEVFGKTLRGWEAAWRARLERELDEVAREIAGG